MFISPQFDASWSKENEDGGTCPDFVALDFEKHEIIIAEVSTRYDLSGLIGRIATREKGWYAPIFRKLIGTGAVTSEWKTRTLCFIRRDRLDYARKGVIAEDVTFQPLEDCLLEYAYHKERQNGLP